VSTYAFATDTSTATRVFGKDVVLQDFVKRLRASKSPTRISATQDVVAPVEAEET
jgi:hypothetical protein